MTLASLTIGLAGIGILVTGYLAVIFLRDPVAAMAQTTHRAEYLPRIMGGRYVGFFLFAIGAALSRDARVIGWLFAVFTVVSLYDVWVYRAGGHRFGPHLAAAVASAIGACVAALAIGGAA
jgi:hypothetical protein